MWIQSQLRRQIVTTAGVKDSRQPLIAQLSLLTLLMRTADCSAGSGCLSSVKAGHLTATYEVTDGQGHACCTHAQWPCLR